MYVLHTVPKGVPTIATVMGRQGPVDRQLRRCAQFLKVPVSTGVFDWAAVCEFCFAVVWLQARVDVGLMM
jgi:hypothetical protein